VGTPVCHYLVSLALVRCRSSHVCCNLCRLGPGILAAHDAFARRGAERPSSRPEPTGKSSPSSFGVGGLVLCPGVSRASERPLDEGQMQHLDSFGLPSFPLSRYLYQEFSEVFIVAWPPATWASTQRRSRAAVSKKCAFKGTPWRLRASSRRLRRMHDRPSVQHTQIRSDCAPTLQPGPPGTVAHKGGHFGCSVCLYGSAASGGCREEGKSVLRGELSSTHFMSTQRSSRGITLPRPYQHRCRPCHRWPQHPLRARVRSPPAQWTTV
jgi:hypothetical protein